MTNDKRVEKLEKRIRTTLNYSDDIPNKKAVKPNKSKLKDLAKDIRINLEDYSNETAIYTRPTPQSK